MQMYLKNILVTSNLIRFTQKKFTFNYRKLKNNDFQTLITVLHKTFFGALWNGFKKPTVSNQYAHQISWTISYKFGYFYFFPKAQTDVMRGL